MSRSQTAGSTTTRSSYAFDAAGRLDAVSTGTPVTWTNQVGVTVNSSTNDLASSSTLPGTGWDGGASSSQVITGDGAMSFRFRENPDAPYIAGLNATDASTEMSDIDYGIRQSTAGYIYVYENGVQICNTSQSGCWFHRDPKDTDVFTVQRTGTLIKYLRNGREFHHSSVPSTGSLRADTAFYQPSNAIGDVTLINGATSGVERNVYDAAGQRVLRVDPDGSKTIYLGSTELRWQPTTPTTVKVARYYPGGTQRNFDGTLTYNLTSHQSTLATTINAATGTFTHQRYLPYGGQRSSTAFTNDKGFLNQTHDPGSGLVYLNNRYHDPTLGTFISVDPLVAATGEAYIYASGNPATLSDPTGLDPDTSAQVRSRVEANGGCTGSSSRAAVARCTGVVSIPDRGGQVSGADVFDVVPRIWGDYYWGAPQEDRSPEYVIELPLDGVTYADVEWMRRNPFMAARVATIRSMIVGRDDVAGNDSAGNARQHMLLAAYLTIEFGEDQARFMLMAHENVNINSGEAFGPLDAPRAMDLTNNDLGVQVGNLAANEFGRSGWDFTTQSGGGLWNDATFTYVDRMIDQLIAARVPVWLE